MEIYLASDHAAYEDKEMVKRFLESKGNKVIDLGTDSPKRCNYPDFAIKLSDEVVRNKGRGILLCGSGIGVSIVANRFKGIRAALCKSASEAKLSREHNDSNVLCLAGRVSKENELKEMVVAWLEGEFEGGRHAERLAIFENLGEEI